MRSTQRIPAYATWMAVAVAGATDRRVEQERGLAELADREADDSRPDLIPWPAHRMLHRANRADHAGREEDGGVWQAGPTR